MSTLGIIPARGGSKGVPRKNVRPLAGKPLLQYTAEAALSAKRLDRVILSTDDQEIAEVGRACGLEVPFLRPGDLAQDESPTLPVMQHAVRFVEDQGDRFDLVCLLQPTNPFRDAEDIDHCIDIMEGENVDSVITVLPVPHEYNPHWVFVQDDTGLLRLSTGEKDPIARRQLLPAAFHREGSIYVVRRDVLMRANSLFGNSIRGYRVSTDRSINIDTERDWELAEAMLSEAHGLNESQCATAVPLN